MDGLRSFPLWGGSGSEIFDQSHKSSSIHLKFWSSPWLTTSIFSKAISALSYSIFFLKKKNHLYEKLMNYLLSVWYFMRCYMNYIWFWDCLLQQFVQLTPDIVGSYIKFSFLFSYILVCQQTYAPTCNGIVLLRMIQLVQSFYMLTYRCDHFFVCSKYSVC